MKLSNYICVLLHKKDGLHLCASSQVELFLALVKTSADVGQYSFAKYFQDLIASRLSSEGFS